MKLEPWPEPELEPWPEPAGAGTCCSDPVSRGTLLGAGDGSRTIRNQPAQVGDGVGTSRAGIFCSEPEPESEQPNSLAGAVVEPVHTLDDHLEDKCLPNILLKTSSKTLKPLETLFKCGTKPSPTQTHCYLRRHKRGDAICLTFGP